MGVIHDGETEMPGVGELKVGVGEYMKIDYRRKKKTHEKHTFWQEKDRKPVR